MGDSEWAGYEANNRARKAGKGVLGRDDPLYRGLPDTRKNREAARRKHSRRKGIKRR